MTRDKFVRLQLAGQVGWVILRGELWEVAELVA